jgi:hypothetical protein
MVRHDGHGVSGFLLLMIIIREFRRIIPVLLLLALMGV